jgi:hypothetical protein
LIDLYHRYELEIEMMAKNREFEVHHHRKTVFVLKPSVIGAYLFSHCKAKKPQNSDCSQLIDMIFVVSPILTFCSISFQSIFITSLSAVILNLSL